MSVDVYDATEKDVLPVLSEQRLLAGSQSVTVDPSSLADGSYTIVVDAVGDDGSDVESVVPLTVSRVLGLVTATPSVFSPNGDGRLDRLTVGFELMAPANVQVRILRNDRWVATPFAASLQAGPQHFVWDGARSAGTLRDGSYEAAVDATGELGTTTSAVPFAVDTVPPRLLIVSMRPLAISVSEPATLKVMLDGVSTRRDVKHAGTIRIPGAGRVKRVRAVAWDEAGNVSRAVVGRSRASP
ncbi:MAG: hypothetical protein E6G28_05485 [Actinobacteria bacterium]|nr:MAG: hypothetical protein E6G28_05485 [Actinomycetota bacterium]